jgi:hypothetical protein
MRLLLLTGLFFIPAFCSMSDTPPLAQRLHDTHATFREPALTDRRFKHATLVPLLESLRTKPGFDVTVAGKSFEGRSIYQVKIGTGPAKVLLWSQMHGDEPTATMALFDLFRFFAGKNDGFDEVRQRILQNCTLYFIPMLNPDGAEVYKRRTALEIDMNRDALRLQTPEGRLLKSLQQSLQPLVGFNLHDQSPRYSAGPTRNLATISFLATAYNPEREINPVRKRSMQLIVGMNRALQSFIPNQVGRYSDEFEPRAFGDNIQRWGTSLVLIESGGYAGDPEKQYIRRLNYVAILSSLHALATNEYEAEDIAQYEQIPENGRALYDLVIRNATLLRDGKPYTADLGINRQEMPLLNRPEKWYVRGTVEDLGDLSTFFGTREIDATGLTVEAEKPLRPGAEATFTLRRGTQVIHTVKSGVPQP